MTSDRTANIGVVGLAVMGSNLARNLASREGNTVAVLNRSAAKTDTLIAEHPEAEFIPAYSYEEFAASLSKPRTAIIMVKAGRPTDAVIDDLVKVFEPGDIIVDGGNALFTDTIRREKAVRDTGINFVGAGISGGEEGALRGPSIMPGGSDESWVTLGPILKSIAAIAEDEPCVTHVGHDGAGHFVKMVHNGIEYGIMAAFAEGLNILDNADAGVREAEHSAEVAPLEEPEYYQFPIDTAKVTELWRRGSVVSSWLLDLTAAALEANPTLDGLAGRVSDSGEGRWTVKAAVDIGVPVPVLAASLFERFASRDEDRFANQVLSAMRLQFGGHQERAAGDVLEAGSRKADHG